MDEHDPHPERLTEELQRQDLQERIANLKFNLEFRQMQEEDNQIAEMERQMRAGITEPESSLHSSPLSASELQKGGPPILPVALPLLYRMQPDNLQE